MPFLASTDSLDRVLFGSEGRDSGALAEKKDFDPFGNMDLRSIIESAFIGTKLMPRTNTDKGSPTTVTFSRFVNKS